MSPHVPHALHERCTRFDLAEWQRVELTDYLRAELGSATGHTVEQLGVVYRLAAQQAVWSQELVDEWRVEAPRRRRHHRSMAAQAEKLVKMLDLDEPHGSMSALTTQAGYSLDWDSLRAGLIRLADVARQEATTLGARPGPRRMKWRSELIQGVDKVFPRGIARKSRGGVFETVVIMMLDWIGNAPSDVHGAVLDALSATVD